MLTHANTRTQYQIASDILSETPHGLFASCTQYLWEAAGRRSAEKQVAAIRVGLEDLRTHNNIKPIPQSTALGFQEDNEQLALQLTTNWILHTVEQESELGNDDVGRLLQKSVGDLVNWADLSKRGDAANNRGRLHFILYIFERCKAIHGMQGSVKLDELQILEKELLWACSYVPFDAGTTNDIHFKDQLRDAHDAIQRASSIQEAEVASAASITMLGELQKHANTIITQLIKYLFALPATTTSPPDPSFEGYAVSDIGFVGSAIMGGMFSVFNLDHPTKEDTFEKLKIKLKALNQYLRLLGNNRLVKTALNVEEKRHNQTNNFLKNQNECTVYDPQNGTVCIYNKIGTNEIYRFDLEELKKTVSDEKKLEELKETVSDEKKLSAYEVDCLIEQKKLAEIKRLSDEKIIESKPVCSIPGGITEYTDGADRLRYWVQHKRLLQTAQAIQNALSVYQEFKTCAKTYGDAGFYLMAHKMLEKIIEIDKDIWQNLDINIELSFQHLNAYRRGVSKSKAHPKDTQITKAKNVIVAKIMEAKKSRAKLIIARDDMLANLKAGKISAVQQMQHMFSVMDSYLDSLATLNQLTMEAASNQQKLMEDMKSAALRTAETIDASLNKAAEEIDSESSEKKPASANFLSPPSSPSTVSMMSELKVRAPQRDHKQADQTYEPTPPPVSVFNEGITKQQRQKRFNDIRSRLGYKPYAKTIDPVAAMVSNWRRWLPWNWWGWRRDIKTGTLVSCHEKCQLFLWTIKESNDSLDENKIDAKSQELESYLENQKQYFGWLRGPAFNKELSRLQNKVRKKSRKAAQDYTQLKMINDWIKRPVGTKPAPQDELLNVNAQVEILNRVSPSVFASKVTKELKAYALSIAQPMFTKQLQQIRDKMKNPFADYSQTIRDELAELGSQWETTLQGDLKELETKFNLNDILKERIRQLELELPQKTGPNITKNQGRPAIEIKDAKQDENQQKVALLLEDVKERTAVYSDPSKQPSDEGQKRKKKFFDDVEKTMRDFLNAQEENAFEKMKQRLETLVKDNEDNKTLSFQSEASASTVRRFCDELKLNVDVSIEVTPKKNRTQQIQQTTSPSGFFLSPVSTVHNPVYVNNKQSVHTRQTSFVRGI